MKAPRSVVQFLCRALLTASILILAVTLNPEASAEVRYLVTNLGNLGSSRATTAYKINNKGQIVGYSTKANLDNHAFLYSQGTMTDLGTLGGNNSYATDINEKGQVVGVSSTATNTTHAFLYSDGIMTDLGTLGGSKSKAYGINDHGQVVGYAYDTNELWHAFLYSGGNMTDLGTLPGGMVSEARDINNNGQVVGFSNYTSNQFTHAFLYSNGIMTDLGTLGSGVSAAYTINDNGQVVGYSGHSTGFSHAFRYSGGTMDDLGVLNSFYSSSSELGINKSGQVVGDVWGGAEHRAFLYSSGGMTNLNQLIPVPGWTLMYAYAINDSGQIVADGFIGPTTAALLLTPLPSLTIKRTGTTLLLSWPATTPTFKLFQSTNLVASTWLAVTNIPTSTNGETQVVLPGPLTGSRVLSAPDPVAEREPICYSLVKQSRRE